MKNNNKTDPDKLFIPFASIIFILVTLSMLAGCGSSPADNTGSTTELGAGSAGTSAVQKENRAASGDNIIASQDDDNDGVNNAEDQCKDTAPDTWVDVKGCALDTDGDTVADSRDACRGTPHGVKVDSRGCGFDDDHDGVPNYRDRCSRTISDVSVDGNGCEWDSDNDGVVDSKDLCAGTPPGVKVEPMGCHIIEIVTLKGVHFRSGSDALSNSAKGILRDVARRLREHPRMRVEVAGHTDNTGSDAINKRLSLLRARSATRFLVELGVNKKVLATHGYGDTQPIASNDSKQGRLQNRRVEMRFIEID
ncbi:MAG: OmpA family protein [Gammaproteobacteria bacterium]|jgi:OOP family OmpA-OmpF porin